MKAGCAAQKLQFEAHGKRDVVADFDGGRMTSDGGGLLLREANCCLGDLMARLGQCVSDFRQQGSVEHTATDLIAQRVCARLRTADRDASDGSVEELERIVGRIRERWPATRIRIRADAGFCRDGILSWCEANAVSYVLGLARNPVLTRRLRHAMRRARRCCWQTGEAVRRFRQFRYRTHSSWSRKRRVIGKAEHLRQGANPRFVVTNLELSEIQPPQRLYEQVYCARGEMENRIKEQAVSVRRPHQQRDDAR